MWSIFVDVPSNGAGVEELRRKAVEDEKLHGEAACFGVL